MTVALPAQANARNARAHLGFAAAVLICFKYSTFPRPTLHFVVTRALQLLNSLYLDTLAFPTLLSQQLISTPTSSITYFGLFRRKAQKAEAKAANAQAATADTAHATNPTSASGVNQSPATTSTMDPNAPPAGGAAPGQKDDYADKGNAKSLNA